MNPQTFRDDRTFNVGGQIGEGTLCPRSSAVGEGGLPGQKSRRHGGVSAMKNRSAKSSTAQCGQSSKPNCVLEEGYVPEQCDMVTPLN